jgi:hypothetical protein
MEALVEIGMSDLLASAALIATAIGLGFTALQIRKNTAIQRGTFFRALYEPFFLNDELQYVFRLISDEENIFGENYGTSGRGDEYNKRQKAVERLFAHFEIICSLYRRRLINDNDMQDFDYNIQRVFNYRGFHDYEANLDSWRKSKGLERGPYSTFF